MTSSRAPRTTRRSDWCLNGVTTAWTASPSSRLTARRRRGHPGARAVTARVIVLEDSQIERTDRLDRLVLAPSVALYWAVSTGMWDALENKPPAEKKPRKRNAKTSRAA